MAEGTRIKRFMQGCLSNLSVLQPLRTPGDAQSPAHLTPRHPQLHSAKEGSLERLQNWSVADFSKYSEQTHVVRGRDVLDVALLEERDLL